MYNIIRRGTVGFNVPLETLHIISEMTFPATHLTGAKTQFKLHQTTTKLQHKNPNNNETVVTCQATLVWNNFCVYFTCNHHRQITGKCPCAEIELFQKDVNKCWNNCISHVNTVLGSLYKKSKTMSQNRHSSTISNMLQICLKCLKFTLSNLNFGTSLVQTKHV